ncbi:MAG: (Fe-S)-binding protein [Promethearchaeota archaeon]
MEQSTSNSEIIANNLNHLINISTFCYSCGKCLTVCPTSLLNIFSPKDFLHNFINEGYIDPEGFIKNENLFNCLTCEKCMMVCPMVPDPHSGIFANFVRDVREYAFSNGLLMEELYNTITHDDIMCINPQLQSDIKKLKNDFSKIRSIPSIKTSEKGSVAFFIGCSSLMQEIFNEYEVNYENSSIGAIALLNRIGISPVVLDTKCCGHDLYWIGNTKATCNLAKNNVELMKQAGVKQIVVECAEGYYMWKHVYPKLVDNFNFEVYHLSEFLLKNNILKHILPLRLEDVKVTYHDPCRLGRLSGIYEAPRDLLKNLFGVSIVEMENNKEMANCCGVSAFKNCNSTTKRIREQRIKEAENTGAEILITTCPKCMTHFNCFLTEYEDAQKSESGAEINKKVKKKEKKLQVMDLAEFIAKRNMLI